MGTFKYSKRETQGTKTMHSLIFKHQNFGIMMIVIRDGVKLYRKRLKEAGKGRSRGIQIGVSLTGKCKESCGIFHFPKSSLQQFRYLKIKLSVLNKETKVNLWKDVQHQFS